MGFGGWRNLAVAAMVASAVTAGPAASVLARSGSAPVVFLSASPNPALSDYTDVYVNGFGTRDSGCKIKSYSFNFGDRHSTTSTYAYVYHYYHVPPQRSSETFTITLTVSDYCGNSGSAQTAEVVDQDQPPAANLTITHSSSNPYAIYADASGTTDKDLTGPYEFDFYWGDGTEKTTYAPTEVYPHAYASAGSYTVRVVAFDFAAQEGVTTQTVAVPTTVQQSAPSNVVAVAGNTQATVSWSAPKSGGTPSSYTVTASPGGATATVGGTASQATVTGLHNGTTYSFTVTPTNHGGSATSQPSNPVTPIAAPGAPSVISAIASNAAAVVSWSAPASHGGFSPFYHRQSPVAYTVTASPGGAHMTVRGNPPATNTTIYGLANSTSYTFTVTASNSTYTGPSSAPSNSVMPSPKGPTIIDPPHWMLVEPSTVGTSSTNLPLPVTVLWAGRAGSDAICSYTLQRSLNNGSWVPIPLTSKTATQASDTIPAPLDLVRYQVQATDCNGVTSSWVENPEFGYNLYEEGSHKFSYSPGWASTACSSCAGGHEASTTVSGATATLTLNAAYNIGLVFAVGPTLGSADIYVDDIFEVVVDTNASTSGYRQLLFKDGWAIFGYHTIKVTNLATPGHPAIALNGAVVLYAPLAKLGS